MHAPKMYKRFITHIVRLSRESREVLQDGLNGSESKEVQMDLDFT